MTRMTFGIALCTLAFVQLEAHALSATSALAKTAGGDDAWIASIRRDHPRMFFNADTWPSIKARTLSEPAVRAQYEKLLRDCDGYPAKPVCKDFGPVDTPPSTPIPHVKEWGAAAAKCAFAWRMTGERKYLDKTKEMLRVRMRITAIQITKDT